MKIKKYISAVLASAMAVSSLSVFSAAAESYGDGDIDIMLLGDSIASGAELDESEYNYGQIVGDYLGGDVWNYAVAGYESSDALAQLRAFDSAQKAQLADSEVVVISIGGNDMIAYATEALLGFAAENDLLSEGKTAADIPEKKNFATLTEFFDMDAVKEYASNMANGLKLNSLLDNIYRELTYTDSQPNGPAYKQIIAKQVIPNIKAMTEEIKTVNPDARVIVQTVYNPLQFSTEYEARLQQASSSTYYAAYVQFKTIFHNSTRRFAEQLREVEGIEIAEVLDNISSTDENGQKYGWYFTNMQSGKENVDIHPTQAGHVAIAVAVLDAIGETREDGGLLAIIKNSLKNSASYPEFAMNNYKKYAGTYVLGDVNGDMSIDSSDASRILEQYSLLSTGKTPTISEDKMKAGKVTDDDILDSADASLILAYYAFTSTGGKDSLKCFLAE